MRESSPLKTMKSQFTKGAKMVAKNANGYPVNEVLIL
jgi:hypothetical protein